MKLRIRGDSIRLRVTQTELDQIRADREVSDSIHFGDGSQLVYRLSAEETVSKPTAEFSADAINVRLPGAAVDRWATTDEVSIRGNQATGGAGTLSILVEKDFACLQPREGEDESDMFANPDAGKMEC